jgi:predicted  nucleic acid-binding Zn-ribbon protein
MYHTTAKLIALERTEAFLARGWPKGSQTAFAEQAKTLRHEIPPHIVAVYGQIKAEHKEAVVGVFEEKCSGGHAPLSQTALKRMNAETEVSRCEHCGRFIYLAGGHNLAPSGQSHQLTGGHARR